MRGALDSSTTKVGFPVKDRNRAGEWLAPTADLEIWLLWKPLELDHGHI